MHKDKASTHTHTHTLTPMGGRCQMDTGQGQVVMLGDFSFLLHCEPSSLFPPFNLSLCCHAAAPPPPPPLTFTFKCLHLAPPHPHPPPPPPLPPHLLPPHPFLGTQHQSSTTSHSFIKSKREVALFLAPVNSTLTDPGPAEDSLPLILTTEA